MFNFDKTVEVLPKGAFLSSGSDKPNTMTLGWMQVGVMWFKKIVIVPIRTSRYTKSIVDETGIFTVSIPFSDNFVDALKVCGSVSGRDGDKFEKANIKAIPAKSVDSVVVDGCDMYYECRVMHKVPLDKETMPEEVAQYYKNNNMHTLYFAEIIDMYSK